MSDIRERAHRLVNMLRGKDDQMCWESLALKSIRDLLAELERMESESEKYRLEMIRCGLLEGLCLTKTDG